MRALVALALLAGALTQVAPVSADGRSFISDGQSVSANGQSVRADGQSVELSGLVHARDGSPIPGATVTVGQQQLVADDHGRWHGAVAFAPVLRESATAPGYVADGYSEISISSPNAISPQFDDTLRSIFDPDPHSYASPQSTPPIVDGFASDTGVERSQEVPAATSSLTVTGSIGQREGHPLVRGDGYVGRPDDFVDDVAVTIQGDRFTALFPIAHGPGAYRVEINDSAGGAIINVPIFVGVPYQPPRPSWPDAADLDGDGPVSRALDALQQVREAHGLPNYALDQRLQQVAQDHVTDMLAHNWICHCWGDGSSVLDHVRAAGVEPAHIPVPGQPNQYTLGVGNGISTDPGAAAIHGLFDSPGHRKDLLGNFTHIGLAYGGRVDDGTSRLSIVYATEK